MANKCKQCDAEIIDNVFCDDECKVRWIYQKYIVEQMGTYEVRNPRLKHLGLV